MRVFKRKFRGVFKPYELQLTAHVQQEHHNFLDILEFAEFWCNEDKGMHEDRRADVLALIERIRIEVNKK